MTVEVDECVIENCDKSSGAGDSSETETERDRAVSVANEVNRRAKERLALRAKNHLAHKHWVAPDDDSFRGLDSGLKRNRAFVKKLKVIDGASLESLSVEFEQLNLHKYMDEVASALAQDIKFKMADVPAAVEMCSTLHQRYESFVQQMLPLLRKQFEVRKDEKLSNSAKIRTEVRYLAELTACGVLGDKEGIPILTSFMSHVLKADRDQHDLLSFVISFVSFCGEDYAGLVPRNVRRILREYPDITIQPCQIFPKELQSSCLKMLSDYFESLKAFFLSRQKQAKDLARRNQNILLSKGELHEEKKEELDAAVAALQKLHQNTSTLADLLDREDVPTLCQELLEAGSDDCDLLAGSAAAVTVESFRDFRMNDGQAEFDTENSRWDDLDTKNFYEDFPDIIPLLPPAAVRAESLLKRDNNDGLDDGEDKDAEAGDGAEGNDKSRTGEADKDHGEEADEDREDEGPTAAAAADGEVGLEDDDMEEEGEEEEGDEDGSADQEGEVAEDRELPEKDENDVATEGTAGLESELRKMQFEKLLTRLPECINRQFIDQVATEFATTAINTQGNRSRLARTLYLVQRTRLDLLPFYSRLVAVIYPCAPEVATELCDCLYREFRAHLMKKDQIKLESKIKVATFIGELTKFGVFPAERTLRVLKQLLKNFRHHCIDMTCALLESCGKFLFRTRSTHRLTAFLLDEMMRKKGPGGQYNLDSRHAAMVDNAYYSTNPPKGLDANARFQEERLPVHLAYVRHLLTKELNKNSVDKVLKQLRKLHWEEKDVADLTVRTLTEIWVMKFNNIQYVASVVAGLVPYHDDVVIRVIDNVLEDVRIGMETQHSKFNQRRVSVLKYLGEMYNYRLVESSLVFNVLFSLITFGRLPAPSVDAAAAAGSVFDPPSSLFRIRLVCTLLDTCGQYFDRGLAKKKLDSFLLYFQRYILEKRTVFDSQKWLFPQDVDNMIQDTIEMLRPQLHLFTTLQQAQDAVSALETELRAKYCESDAGQQNGVNLYAISEEAYPEDDSKEYHDGSLPIEAGYRGDDSMDEQLEDMCLSDQLESSVPKPKLIDCPENDEFVDEFERFMSENIQSRTSELARGALTTGEVALPLGTKKALQQSHKQTVGDQKVNLMLKKGNKITLKSLDVEVTEEMVESMRQQQLEEDRERQKMIAVTLSINQRQQEEELQEAASSVHCSLADINRTDKKARQFQHPKGAPNTDQIFGSGGKRR